MSINGLRRKLIYQAIKLLSLISTKRLSRSLTWFQPGTAALKEYGHTVSQGRDAAEDLTRRIQQHYLYLFRSWFVVSFHGKGFANYGYWDETTRTGEEANNNLVDKVVSLIPEVGSTVLEVGCGHGGCTKRLLNYYPSSNITAINIAQDQLTRAKLLAPGCQFLKMDAAQLTFKDATFDNVISIEAALHFNTRERFLAEAYRVLKPGGWIALSDTLYRRPSKGNERSFPAVLCTYTENVPFANLCTYADYVELFRKIGFDRPTVIRARKRTWGTFRVQALSHIRRHRGWKVAARAWMWFLIQDSWVEDYLLVEARKPAAT